MLNDVEKAFVTRFVDEDEMMVAIRKAVKNEINNLLPIVKPTDTDEILGQRTRAFNTSCELIDTAFNAMARFRSKEKSKDVKNLER